MKHLQLGRRGVQAFKECGKGFPETEKGFTQNTGATSRDGETVFVKAETGKTTIHLPLVRLTCFREFPESGTNIGTLLFEFGNRAIENQTPFVDEQHP